jgi:hypothetical protein
MKFSQYLAQLDEAKTPQLIGYHATTVGNAYHIKSSGVLKANPKNARWTHDRGVASLKDSVYVELDPAKAIRWYGDELSSGLIVIQFTEKTALSDPQYDIKAFIYNFIHKESNNLSDILDPSTIKPKMSIDELGHWCESRTEIFRKEFHNFLAKGNERVPDKTNEVIELLFYFLLDNKSYYFKFDSEKRQKVSERYHELLKKVSDSYKGFKRTVSTAMRLPYDVGMTGRNRIIGILTAPVGTDAGYRRNDFTYSGQEKTDAEKDADIKNSHYDIIWGNPKEIREKTGLTAMGDYNDRQQYYWDKHQKEKAEQEAKRKELKKQKDKERRAAKKAATMNVANTENV